MFGDTVFFIQSPRLKNCGRLEQTTECLERVWKFTWSKSGWLNFTFFILNF